MQCKLLKSQVSTKLAIWNSDSADFWEFFTGGCRHFCSFIEGDDDGGGGGGGGGGRGSIQQT